MWGGRAQPDTSPDYVDLTPRLLMLHPDELVWFHDLLGASFPVPHSPFCQYIPTVLWVHRVSIFCCFGNDVVMLWPQPEAAARDVHS